MLSAAALCASLTAAHAGPINVPPPTGAILDLAGQPITNTQQVYSVNFLAAVANTAITFAFRQDPDFESFSNVSVVNLTNNTGNLLVNGDFSQGTLNTTTVTGWTYANIYGATFGGVLKANCGVNHSNCWYDGAVQAYDAISQTIPTVIGDEYQITFNLNGGHRSDGDGGSSSAIYSRLSTNGHTTDTSGNGIDVLVYAQAGLPAPAVSAAPEPATWAMLLFGFFGIGMMLRHRPSKAAAHA